MSSKEIKLDNAWFDEHGLLSKLAPWAESNLTENGSYFTVLPEQYLPGYANHVVHIRRQTPSPLKPAVVIDYVPKLEGEFLAVRITEREMTVSKYPDIDKAWRVYRPMITRDGSVSYKLVREVVMMRYAPEGCPAFVNYMLQRAFGIVWRYLEKDSRVGDDLESFIEENFQDYIIADRTMSDYNNVRTTGLYLEWFDNLQAFVNNCASTEHSLTTLIAALHGFGSGFAEIAKNLPDSFPDGSPELAVEDDGFGVDIENATFNPNIG